MFILPGQVLPQRMQEFNFSEACSVSLLHVSYCQQKAYKHATVLIKFFFYLLKIIQSISLNSI